jgi:hypothetical protein
MDASPSPQPEQPSRPLDDQINWDVYAEVARNFRDILPPPENDTQEALDRRNRAAIGIVSSLVPVTVAEGTVAADYVICYEQAHEAFRAARVITDNPDRQKEKLNWALRYVGKANACMATLLRMQSERRKREATPKGAMFADACESNVLHYLAVSLGYAEPTEAATRQPELPPEPEPESEPPPPEPPKLTEGERYAAIYPDRARLIRKHGGVPDYPLAKFGPPARRIVNELLNSVSPLILALDDA